MVHGLNEVVVGDKIAVDNMGRPIKWTEPTDASILDDSGAQLHSGGTHGPAVGVVKAVEVLGTDAFDTGMLEYMVLPYETFANALVSQALTLHNPHADVSTTPLFGYRGNLDVDSVLGAFRVQLYKM
jgi:hypothetical protein